MRPLRVRFKGGSSRRRPSKMHTRAACGSLAPA